MEGLPMILREAWSRPLPIVPASPGHYRLRAVFLRRR
jgi:hypothetical protein